MFRKVLVANRGEIAIRVFRTANELGVRTVAVYSDADSGALHAMMADEAMAIGASEPAASYLNVDAIIAAAKATGAQAVHPGYGFLSERSSFARACQDAGLVFIGPGADAMDRLGAKIDAKTLAVANSVPVTPGFFEVGASDAALKKAAAEIGYPVMLKASAGGGGRGMRVVRQPDEFDRELALASEEAVKAFGDGAMMVEKLVERPRHIEVQLLADRFGNVATLFERECSLQRRHQKIIEESPSPVMTDPLWKSMREAARTLALAAGYEGAGTVEFMVDETSGKFYFLEVNARLQVEHPVTEAVTGLDLVEWQLRIAAGEKLDLPSELMNGDRTAISGHAMEARLVAEDPAMGFLPSVGKIVGWAEPKAPGLRFDTGFGPGAEVSRYYDSLIGKLIAHSSSREGAIAKLRSGLADTHVLGVKTNVGFLLDVLGHPDFASAHFDTGWIGRTFEHWTPDSSIPAGLFELVQAASELSSTAGPERRLGMWDVSDGFRNARAEAP